MARKAKKSPRSSKASRVKAKTSRPKGANGATDLVAKIRKDIWPDERAVLFKPDRLRYVRKMIKPDGCVFCAAVENGVGPDSLLLYKGENAIVVMNKYPYNTGHILILPRRHCGDFLKIEPAEHQAISDALKRTIHALEEAYKPAGFNVGLNLGAAAGAGIPEHLHYHVIPRWNGDTNFFPIIAETKVVVETLETTFERLLPFFT